jgi:hypothetical protein
MFQQKPLLGVLLVVYFMYPIDSRASALMAGANVSSPVLSAGAKYIPSITSYSSTESVHQQFYNMLIYV